MPCKDGRSSQTTDTDHLCLWFVVIVRMGLNPHQVMHDALFIDCQVIMVSSVVVQHRTSNIVPLVLLGVLLLPHHTTTSNHQQRRATTPAAHQKYYPTTSHSCDALTSCLRASSAGHTSKARGGCMQYYAGNLQHAG